MPKTTVKDPWCQLAGGYKCWVNNPRRTITNREMCAEILPQAGSKICRFGAQIREFYSLAQHCVGVSRYLEAKGFSIVEQLQGLLHDSGEMILGGDIPKPVREKIYGYDRIEAAFLDQILRVYELPPLMDDSKVWDADVALLVVEAEQFLDGGPLDDWTKRYAPAEVDRHDIRFHAFGHLARVYPWTMQTARDEFDIRLRDLTRQHLLNLRDQNDSTDEV